MATIYQRGSVWRASIRVGKGKSISRTFDSEAQADRWATEEEARIRGGLTVEAIAAIPASTTWVQLFERFMAEVTEHRRGRTSELHRFRLLCRFPVFAKPITELTGVDVEEWVVERLKSPRGGRTGKRTISPSSVNRELATMSAVAKHAKTVWKLPDKRTPIFTGVNPFTAFAWPKPAKPRRRRVSPQERAAIAVALGWDGVSEPTTKRQLVAWCHAFACITMMRSGEILSVTGNDIHPRHIHLDRSKNGDERDVPLSKEALALLALLPAPIGAQKLIPLNAGTRSDYFRDAVKAAGIPDMRFHDSRREAICVIGKKLKNPMHVAKISGHRDMRVLQRVYFTPEPDELADMLDA